MGFRWWARLDLNQRPDRYERSALTRLSYTLSSRLSGGEIRTPDILLSKQARYQIAINLLLKAVIKSVMNPQEPRWDPGYWVSR